MARGLIFQSTLPARGATVVEPIAPYVPSDFNPRSPHGERPALRILKRENASDFNPRSPHGERQKYSEILPKRKTKFQSTLPARGATRFSMLADTTFKHFNPRSPHGERQNSSGSYTAGLHFNPRSPHGERQQTVWKHSDIRRNFNPRSPHGERPRQYIAILAECAFQSTLPARGATLTSMDSKVMSIFQSTLPARGATFRHAGVWYIPISIHAPRTGSDVFPAKPRAFCAISIHAPRTGSDASIPGLSPP